MLVQGQGGAQSIEDGVVVGLVLCSATHENIPERLKLFENIRRNRASVMQIFSNAGQDEGVAMHEKASKYMPLERIPSMSTYVLVPPYTVQY
jgi:salicylate hydroxylase